jgi:hypothetical protein
MGMKKVISIPTLLFLVSTVACTGEADSDRDSKLVIGSQPVTCTGPVGAAEVEGSVIDPATGIHYDLGAASTSARIYPSGSATLSINNEVLDLRLGFYCNTHAPGSYELVADSQEGVQCPIEVAGAVFGVIPYLPAESGEVIVDDSGNCMAGRFHASFGGSGELTGWFRAPWSPYP